MHKNQCLKSQVNTKHSSTCLPNTFIVNFHAKNYDHHKQLTSNGLNRKLKRQLTVNRKLEPQN